MAGHCAAKSMKCMPPTDLKGQSAEVLEIELQPAVRVWATHPKTISVPVTWCTIARNAASNAFSDDEVRWSIDFPQNSTSPADTCPDLACPD